MSSKPSKSSRGTGMFSSKTSYSGDSSSPERASKQGPQSFVFSLDHRPRATRASVPKVRSGCVTCERRHVKCDEAKPACQRCVKWQGFCDGYKPQELVPPKDNKRRQSAASSHSDRSTSAPPSSAETFLGEELQVPEDVPQIDPEWESIYSTCWSTLSNNLGGGWFPTPLFSQTIPQISQDEPAIRYAVVAVGALACALAPNTIPPLPSTDVALDYHYNAALTYYGYALRLIRLQQECENGSTLRVAVVACILFACFEILHGSYEAAVNHINYGGLIIAGRASIGALGEEACSQHINKGKSSGSSSSHLALENEILQVFHRLRASSWSAYLHGSVQIPHTCLETSNNLNINSMPSKFSSLGEARLWWDLVQHQTLHFNQAVADQVAAIFGMRELQLRYMSILEKWNATFWPLYTSSTSSRKGSLHYQAVSLLLQSIIAHICVNTVCFHDSYMLQEVTSQFSEIVRLAGILLPNQPLAPGCLEAFTLEHGPTFALYMASIKCIDPSVQADAVSLLSRYPRRDAFWDSRGATIGASQPASTYEPDATATIDPLLHYME
ncbi:hypothetical protein QBC35DRAFT_539261 [Podospora australis]|uniref:Zn(2)-C6 fungal-type domain-containing protein n=1 Tax=Podospora australis TaxID=1536484 RepID=A0AAN6WNE1_9PEZI|nr:hypothetical protein QBC35DRAFT_539261 [Podospora australis]